jgi:hypothetical protein
MTPFNINPALQLVNLGSLFGSRLLPAGGIDISFPQIPQLGFSLAWLGLGNIGSPWRVADQYYGGGYGGLPGGGFKGIGDAPSGEGDQGEKAGPAAPAGGAVTDAAVAAGPRGATERRDRRERTQTSVKGTDGSKQFEWTQHLPSPLESEEFVRQFQERMRRMAETMDNPWLMGSILLGAGYTSEALRPLIERGEVWIAERFHALRPTIQQLEQFSKSWQELISSDKGQQLESDIFKEIDARIKDLAKKFPGDEKLKEAAREEILKIFDSYIDIHRKQPGYEQAVAALEKMRDSLSKLDSDIVAKLNLVRDAQLIQKQGQIYSLMDRIDTRLGNNTIFTKAILDYFANDLGGQPNFSLKKHLLNALEAAQQTAQQTLQGNPTELAAVNKTLDELKKILRESSEAELRDAFGEKLRELNPEAYQQARIRIAELAARSSAPLYVRAPAGVVGHIARSYAHTLHSPLFVVMATLQGTQAYYKYDGDMTKVAATVLETYGNFGAAMALHSAIEDAFGRTFMRYTRVPAGTYSAALSYLPDKVSGGRFSQFAARAGQQLSRAGEAIAQKTPRWLVGTYNYLGRPLARAAIAETVGLATMPFRDPLGTFILATCLELSHTVHANIKYGDLVSGRYSPEKASEFWFDFVRSKFDSEHEDHIMNLILSGSLLFFDRAYKELWQEALKEHRSHVQTLENSLKTFHHLAVESEASMRIGIYALRNMGNVQLKESRSEFFDGLMREHIRTSLNNELETMAVAAGGGLAGLAVANGSPSSGLMKELDERGVLDLYRNFNINNLRNEDNKRIVSLAYRFGYLPTVTSHNKEHQKMLIENNVISAVEAYVGTLMYKRTLLLQGIHSLRTDSFEAYKKIFSKELQEIDENLDFIRKALEYHGLKDNNLDAIVNKYISAAALEKDRNNPELKEKVKKALVSFINLDNEMSPYDKQKNTRQTGIELLESLVFDKYRQTNQYINVGGETKAVTLSVYREHVLKQMAEKLLSYSDKDTPSNAIINLRKDDRAYQDQVKKNMLTQVFSTTIQLNNDEKFNKYIQTITTRMHMEMLQNLGTLALQDAGFDKYKDTLKENINLLRVHKYIFDDDKNPQVAWEKLVKVTSAIEMMTKLIVDLEKDYQAAKNPANANNQQLQQQLARNISEKARLMELIIDASEKGMSLEDIINDVINSDKSDPALRQLYSEILQQKMAKKDKLTSKDFEEEITKLVSTLSNARTKLRLSKGDKGYDILRNIDEAKGDEDKKKILSEGIDYILADIETKQNEFNKEHFNKKDKHPNAVRLNRNNIEQINGGQIYKEEKESIIGSLREHVQALRESVVKKVTVRVTTPDGVKEVEKVIAPHDPRMRFANLYYQGYDINSLWKHSVYISTREDVEGGLPDLIAQIEKLDAGALSRGKDLLPQIVQGRLMAKFGLSISDVGTFTNQGQEVALQLSKEMRAYFQSEMFNNRMVVLGDTAKVLSNIFDQLQSFDNETAKQITNLIKPDIVNAMFAGNKLYQQITQVEKEMIHRREDATNKEFFKFMGQIKQKAADENARLLFRTVQAINDGKLNGEWQEILNEQLNIGNAPWTVNQLIAKTQEYEIWLNEFKSRKTTLNPQKEIQAMIYYLERSQSNNGYVNMIKETLLGKLRNLYEDSKRL